MKKLKLNKQTISNLSMRELRGIIGKGEGTFITCGCSNPCDTIDFCEWSQRFCDSDDPSVCDC